MSDNVARRCGTVTTMSAPETVFTLEVSLSEDLALSVKLDAPEEIHVDDVIELLVETIAYLEGS